MGRGGERRGEVGGGGARRGAARGPWKQVSVRQEASSQGRGQGGSRDRQSPLKKKDEAGGAGPKQCGRCWVPPA